MRSRIWIGDAVRALETAQTPAEEVRVLELLGFAATALLSADATDLSSRPESTVGPESRPRGAEQQPPEQPLSTPDVDRTPVATDQLPGLEDALAELPLLRPVRVETTAIPAVPLEPLARPGGKQPPLPYMPLFVPRWTGAILRTIASRRVDDGLVDVAALVDIIARGRPVARLPRLPVPTLRYGLQVLVDRGSGMQPFRRDQNHLVQEIRSVVGEALVEVGYFSDFPLRGTGPGPRWTRTSYRPPEPGRPVLLLSDLGIGGPHADPRRSTRAEWEEFVGLVSRAGCTVVALCPYPQQRRPHWLARLLPVIGWDRTTAAGRSGERAP
ncbi:hypothetical protein [Streptomyces sp. NBC_00343]|uniref:hypothetical protein n=1 Tax=Streptomyces sp. NBC_00343 TaxID=2975719 RepID=UPI002E2881BC|nr:hypothetical protein [Streptomyces sp. NBC_00343]